MSSSIALKEDSKDYTGYGFNCFHIINMLSQSRWLRQWFAKPRSVVRVHPTAPLSYRYKGLHMNNLYIDDENRTK